MKVLITGGSGQLGYDVIKVFKEKDILQDANLSILESMKLIEKIKNTKNKKLEKIEELLWEFTFKK